MKCSADSSFVRTAPCPRCQSLRTLSSLNADGSVFMRFCYACSHEWDKSDICRAMERMTFRQLDDWIEHERADDIRWGRNQ